MQTLPTNRIKSNRTISKNSSRLKTRQSSFVHKNSFSLIALLKAKVTLRLYLINSYIQNSLHVFSNSTLIFDIQTQVQALCSKDPSSEKPFCGVGSSRFQSLSRASFSPHHIINLHDLSPQSTLQSLFIAECTFLHIKR